MAYGRKRKSGYRSGFEEKIVANLTKRKVTFGYETVKLQYVIPESLHKYTPDIELPGPIYVELKGRFTATDRKKMLLVRKSNPFFDIRLVFQNADVKIQKGSSTSYGDWATKNGFIWANKEIPDDWLKHSRKKR